MQFSFYRITGLERDCGADSRKFVDRLDVDADELTAAANSIAPSQRNHFLQVSPPASPTRSLPSCRRLRVRRRRRRRLRALSSLAIGEPTFGLFRKLECPQGASVLAVLAKLRFHVKATILVRYHCQDPRRNHCLNQVSGEQHQEPRLQNNTISGHALGSSQIDSLSVSAGTASPSAPTAIRRTSPVQVTVDTIHDHRQTATKSCGAHARRRHRPRSKGRRRPGSWSRGKGRKFQPDVKKTIITAPSAIDADYTLVLSVRHARHKTELAFSTEFLFFSTTPRCTTLKQRPGRRGQLVRYHRHQRDAQGRAHGPARSLSVLRAANRQRVRRYRHD